MSLLRVVGEMGGTYCVAIATAREIIPGEGTVPSKKERDHAAKAKTKHPAAHIPSLR